MKRFLGMLFPLFSLAFFGGAFSVQAAGKTITNGIGMEFVLIPAGEFMMGGLLPDEGNFKEERRKLAMEAQKPVHRVRITRPFYMGRYEVTQAEWAAVMGNNPSYAAPGTLRWRSGAREQVEAAANPARFDEWRRPVERVSWDEAQEFVRRLNAREGTNRYRLPTEAEWEYAARAGGSTRFVSGDDAVGLARHAWYGLAMVDDNSPLEFIKDGVGMDVGVGAAMPVGLREPNAWGLFDMFGNVMEWCGDWFDPAYYAQSPEADPQGPAEGAGFEWDGRKMPPMRVVRGGSFNSEDSVLTTTLRVAASPRDKDTQIGFRLVYAGYD
jgi:formylglycine-generating enzyme required for sulfatase activity